MNVPKSIALPKRFRRFTDYAGLRIGTTGIPLALLTRFYECQKLGNLAELTRWANDDFRIHAGEFLFVVPDGESPKVPAGLPALDLTDAASDDIMDLWLWAADIRQDKNEGGEAAGPLDSSSAETPKE